MLRQSLLRDERVCLPVPQIPRRRANQLGNLVRVLKLGAIHPDHRPRVPEQYLRRGFHNARLPRPGRPQEQQVAHRTSLRAHPRQEDLVEVHQSANAFLLTDDPSRRSIESQEFDAALRHKIVGQEEGIRALVELYQVFLAGMCPQGRPVGNLLFLGPTGSGKTRIVEAAAEILFGDPRAVIRVDCAEFQHSHEIAKLIGSPPGYLGDRETAPFVTQGALAQYHTEKLKLSFLLFDEIEKASDALWQLLLGILDKATLTLGDNRRVDLSATMIFLTSNPGGGEITELMPGGI